ncbi:MAG: hypothetical protein EXR69_08940 [Myxococcales bacterium]|nr:hypothetical protein [Myxococcales bacterium]
MQLRAPLRYRADFYTSVFGNVIVLAVGGVMIGTMFHHIPTLVGWTVWEVIFLWSWLETVVAFTHLTCAGLLVFNRQYLVNGELDRMLLRPGDPLLGVIVDNVSGQELPGCFVAMTALGVAAFQLGLGWSALLIVPGVVGSLAVFASILIVFASLGFHVRHSGTAVGVVFQAASYARYPFELYPRPVRMLLILGLLGFLAYIPAGTLLGRVAMGWVHLPIAALCLAGAYGFYRLGLNRYSSTGT